MIAVIGFEVQAIPPECPFDGSGRSSSNAFLAQSTASAIAGFNAISLSGVRISLLNLALEPSHAYE